jgi:hypothetical protein
MPDEPAPPNAAPPRGSRGGLDVISGPTALAELSLAALTERLPAAAAEPLGAAPAELLLGEFAHEGGGDSEVDHGVSFPESFH